MDWIDLKWKKKWNGNLELRESVIDRFPLYIFKIIRTRSASLLNPSPSVNLLDIYFQS